MKQRPQEIQRYFTEHIHIPFLFFAQPPEFLRRLATRREELVTELFHVMRLDSDLEEFDTEDVVVWTEQKSGRYCAVVALPEPQVPLRCSMIGFSMKEDGSYPIYRTIELQADGRHCLCGWTPNHSRLNLGKAPDNISEMRKRMLEELSSSDTELLENFIDMLNRGTKKE